MTDLARRHEGSKVTKKGYGENTSVELENLAAEIIDAGLAVHRQLGPGLLESVYEECLYYELLKRGLNVLRQVQVPIFYDGRQLATPLRMDLLVNNMICVDIKAVDEFNRIFTFQMRTYLKLARLRLGLILNFNVILFKDGIKRVIL
jgi:GxxExxY protein